MIATLARASVEGTLVVAFVWLLARLLHLSPAARTVLWWCAAAKFVIALMWTAPVELALLPAPSPAVTTTIHRVSAPEISEKAGSATSPRRRKAAASTAGLSTSVANGLREWSSFAAIGWGLGLVAVVFAGIRRWRETARTLRASVAAPDVVQAQAAELASCLGLRTVPQVRVSASAETPLVMGLFRPVVLLPAHRLDTLTDDQRRMVICHELAHLKRADLWLGCVPALAERVFFFHPFAHVASREYALAREAACDASVMRTLDAAPQEYGRLLLALGVSPCRSGLSAAGAAWSFRNLKRRIAMLQDTSVRPTRSRILTATIVGLAMATLIPLRLVARPAQPQTVPTDAPSPAVEREVPRERVATVGDTADKDDQAAKSDERRNDKKDLRFVLMSEDGSRTTSGAFESQDVARAERQRRNNQPLLWFTYDGKEYVIRDVEVLRQVRDLWNDVYRPDFDADSLRKLTQSVESLNVDQLAEQGALIAKSVLDSKLVADQAQLVAEQGRQAAEIGLMVAAEVLRGLTDGGLDEAKLEQQLKSLDKLEIDRHVHSIDKLSDEMKEEIEDKMHDLEHRVKSDLDIQMKDLHKQLRSLEPQLKELGHQFDHFGDQLGHQLGSQLGEHIGRSVDEAMRSTLEEMREIIERSIANGQARPVR